MQSSRKRKKRKLLQTRRTLRDFFLVDATTTSGLSCRRILAGGHTIDFAAARKPAAPLVVTFEPMWFGSDARDANRDGWGFQWLVEQGFHVLAIKPSTNDWYRDPALIKLFGTFQEVDAFKDFSKTIFYGGSMGGYGALAFAEAAPGAVVLSLNPQSTLDEARVPWETRFPEGRAADWSGGFSDAADVGQRGVSAWVVYDPHDSYDRRHADRLGSKGITHLPIPFVGHGVPAVLNKMGVLKEVFLAAVDSSLTPQSFALLARRRKLIGNYWYSIGGLQRSSNIKRAMFTRGIEVDPQFPSCHIALARALQSDGELHTAEQVLHVALKQFPYNAETLGAYSDVLFANARLDEALIFAQRCADRVPTDPRGHLRIARLQAAAGRTEAAREQAQAALLQSSKWPGVAFSARQMLTRLGNGN